MTTTAKLRIALIVLVLAATFYVSYSDIVSVALRFGAPGRVAFAWPVCIDGMILVSALTLVTRTGVSRATKTWARFGRWFGFSGTIYCNGLAAHTDAVLVITFYVIPAVALITVTELLIHAAQGTAASRRQARTQPAGKASRGKLRAV